MDDMTKKIPGLFRRPNGYWYYRARVPKDLHRFCLEREKWIALGTRDEQEARTKFHLVAAEKLQEYAVLREKYRPFLGRRTTEASSSTVLVVDRDEAVLLAKSYLRRCLSTTDSRKTARDFGSSADDVREEIRTDIGALCDPEDTDDGRFLVQNTARELLQWSGRTLLPQQSIDVEFLSMVRRALVALRTIELNRLDGNFRDDPGDADLIGFSKAVYTAEKKSVPALTVEGAIDKIWKEQIEAEHKADKTVVKYKAAFNLLARFLGPNAVLRDVTREQLIEYRDTLRRMPSNYSKKFAESLSFSEIVDEAAALNAPLLQYKSREAYIFMMKRLFRWASANDYIGKDISADIRVGGKPVAGRRKRRGFREAELNAIFNAPVFTGCVDDGRNYSKRGPMRPRRSRFWLPLIALYTGMRMGEILQLRASHVRISPKGYPFLYLTDGFGEDDGDKDFVGMELKTFNSRREVPIHPVLVSAGFLKFVESIRARGEEELFPEVPVAADGKKSTIFSKRFSRFLVKAGVKSDGSGNCFHMFRHTLRDVIRECGISSEIADAVQGWAREGDEGRNYGLGFSADAIAPIWNGLRYPGFNYQHLTRDGP